VHGRGHDAADAFVPVVPSNFLDDVDLGGRVETPRWNRHVVVVAGRRCVEADGFEQRADLGGVDRRTEDAVHSSRAERGTVGRSGSSPTTSMMPVGDPFVRPVRGAR